MKLGHPCAAFRFAVRAVRADSSWDGSFGNFRSEAGCAAKRKHKDKDKFQDAPNDEEAIQSVSDTK